MKKSTAKNLDSLLGIILKSNGEAFRAETLKIASKHLNITDEDLLTAIATFRTDGFVTPIFHPELPNYDMGVFDISEKGIKFLKIQGGYTKNRRRDYYKESNVRFTFIRHWVWFLFLILSLLLNAYLLLKKN